jgi:hypothetical protein
MEWQGMEWSCLCETHPLLSNKWILFKAKNGTMFVGKCAKREGYATIATHCIPDNSNTSTNKVPALVQYYEEVSLGLFEMWAYIHKEMDK